MNHFTYRIFDKRSDAVKLQKLLHDGDIPCQLAPSDEDRQSWALTLANEDYVRAELFLYDHQMADINQLPDDYYLHSFTDEELIGILKNKGDWGEIDYALALKILNDRGLKYPKEILDKYEQEYLVEKQRKEKMEEDLISNKQYGNSPFGLLLESVHHLGESTDGHKLKLEKFILFIIFFIAAIITALIITYYKYNN